MPDPVAWVAEVGDRQSEIGPWFHATFADPLSAELVTSGFLVTFCDRYVAPGEYRTDEPSNYCKPCKTAFDAL